MLYGLLLTLFVLLCFFLLLLILVQKSKGSLGMGSLGGSTQMLFGASGGQDLFQKITWFCGAIFMVGSLALALMNAHNSQTSRYLSSKSAPVTQQASVEVPAAPALPQSEAQ